MRKEKEKSEPDRGKQRRRKENGQKNYTKIYLFLKSGPEIN